MDQQTARSLRVGQGNAAIDLHYWLFLPDGYRSESGARASAAWPLLVFLHGRGERGPLDGSKLDLVKTWGPPKRVAENSRFPFVLVSPQCPDSRTAWNLEHLIRMLDTVVSEHHVDPDRVYLTGLSMGGRAAWDWAALQPDRFAAMVPICGGGDPARAENLRELPIWAFHGEDDEVIPLADSQEMVDAILRAGGARVKLTVYPGVGHNSWSRTYANQAVYDWLLSHRRRPVDRSPPSNG